MAKIEAMLEERLENEEEQFSDDDEMQIGDKLSDFEILKILNKNIDINSYIAKVRSLKNDKIYAMKKFSLDGCRNQDIEDNSIDELNKLKELNHYNIIKYYKYFADKDSLYLIMEYMDNGDIEDFIEVHKKADKPIKEEEIWNILLQCSSALEYIDSNNYLNYGIRLDKILFNTDKRIKISIYNESYNEDDIKDIVYDLGSIICDLVKSNNEIDYSEQLIDLYKKMINDDINLRPDAIKLYKIVKNEYSQKYPRNTSINSVLRCLHSNKNLILDIFAKKEDIINNKENKLVSYYFYKAMNALSGFEEYYYHNCLLEFKHLVSNENTKKLENNSKDNGEVDPLYFLVYLLEELHKELNINKKINKNDEENEKKKYIINLKFNGEEEDRKNKIKTLEKYTKYLQENFNSPIFNLFYGLIKTKRVCSICRIGNYYFSCFSFVVFDISKVKEDNNKFNIMEDGFKKQHNAPKKIKVGEPNQIYCEKCLNYTEHYEFDSYYTMSNQLIICFYTGNNSDVEIIFEKNLDLTDYVEDQNSPKKYQLVGSINRIIEEGKKIFSFFAKDPEKSNWIADRSRIKDSIVSKIKKEGQIIMLFYVNNQNK